MRALPPTLPRSAASVARDCRRVMSKIIHRRRSLRRAVPDDAAVNQIFSAVTLHTARPRGARRQCAISPLYLRQQRICISSPTFAVSHTSLGSIRSPSFFACQCPARPPAPARSSSRAMWSVQVDVERRCAPAPARCADGGTASVDRFRIVEDTGRDQTQGCWISVAGSNALERLSRRAVVLIRFDNKNGLSPARDLKSYAVRRRSAKPGLARRCIIRSPCLRSCGFAVGTSRRAQRSRSKVVAAGTGKGMFSGTASRTDSRASSRTDNHQIIARIELAGRAGQSVRWLLQVKSAHRRIRGVGRSLLTKRASQHRQL
ncbi:hypothetical protein KCP77_23625 [Salmonella enterica subsp. enterica]|nr:hypothetical protein KCP77_23625 [Salmonella enterica subsp. enterica]